MMMGSISLLLIIIMIIGLINNEKTTDKKTSEGLTKPKSI